MSIKSIFTVFSIVLALGLPINSSANSIGFDSSTYLNNSFIVVSLNYDFTDFAMIGGAVDIQFDSNVLVFLGFTQARMPPDVVITASPTGAFISPGLYSGVGVGTWFFDGISSAGTIGTLTFRTSSFGTPIPTSCGLTLCILPNDTNPLVSLGGEIVSDELINNGISGANLVVPLPAAGWLLLSALAGIAGLSRKSN